MSKDGVSTTQTPHDHAKPEGEQPGRHLAVGRQPASRAGVSTILCLVQSPHQNQRQENAFNSVLMVRRELAWQQGERLAFSTTLKSRDSNSTFTKREQLDDLPFVGRDLPPAINLPDRSQLDSLSSSEFRCGFLAQLREDQHVAREGVAREAWRVYLQETDRAPVAI